MSAREIIIFGLDVSRVNCIPNEFQPSRDPSTGHVGGMAPPISTMISACMKCVQERSPPSCEHVMNTVAAAVQAAIEGSLAGKGNKSRVAFVCNCGTSPPLVAAAVRLVGRSPNHANINMLPHST